MRGDVLDVLTVRQRPEIRVISPHLVAENLYFRGHKIL